MRRRAEVAPPPDVEVVDLPERWRRRPWIPYLIMGALIVATFGAGLAVEEALKQPVPASLEACRTSIASGPHMFTAPQPVCILPHHKYQATVYTTQGKVVIELLPDTAPETVNNFVVLALHGYYNQLTFWNSQDWVIQGGDPNGDGTGGPGYNLSEEANDNLKWDVGSVGMARVPGGPINGSQFFIIKGPWPGTGPTATYNRFGTVIEGMDKAQALTSNDKINYIAITIQ